MKELYFFPSEDQDFLITATGIDSTALIETLEDYWSFVAEVTQFRADLKAGHNADKVTSEMHQLQKDFIENQA